jgi:hypothetical protein
MPHRRPHRSNVQTYAPKIRVRHFSTLDVTKRMVFYHRKQSPLSDNISQVQHINNRQGLTSTPREGLRSKHVKKSGEQKR